jgi:hypothetical protein
MMIVTIENSALAAIIQLPFSTALLNLSTSPVMSGKNSTKLAMIATK